MKTEVPSRTIPSSVPILAGYSIPKINRPVKLAGTGIVSPPVLRSGTNAETCRQFLSSTKAKDQQP